MPADPRRPTGVGKPSTGLEVGDKESNGAGVGRMGDEWGENADWAQKEGLAVVVNAQSQPLPGPDQLSQIYVAISLAPKLVVGLPNILLL